MTHTPEAPVIGIDVGGTGIKAAAVRVADGSLVSGRHKLLTPAGGKPDDVADTVARVCAQVDAELAAAGVASDPVVGVCLPAVVRAGRTLSAANIDRAWIGLDAERLLSDRLGRRCVLLNDADAAGHAELDFGAARDQPGLSLVLTLGTGIGSALLSDGVLVPGTELGHLELAGRADYEKYASPKNITRHGLSLADWRDRLTTYLEHLEMLFTPDRFILGGSISKDADEFLPIASVTAPILAAHFRNNAGIVGSAGFAARHRAAPAA